MKMRQVVEHQHWIVYRTSAAFGVLKSGCTCLSPYTDLALVTSKKNPQVGQWAAGGEEWRLAETG